MTIDLIKKYLTKFLLLNKHNDECINELKMSLGRIENRQIPNKIVEDVKSVEFRVFSQWGEDGIIQYLLKHVKIEERKFIEFGVENYLESNTRFLLQNNNWSGLIIDGLRENIDFIKNDQIYWRHELTAVNEFVTKDNINDIFIRNNFFGDIGVLSIDIDGNDYWVFEAIQVVNPSIIVCEYNSIFGPEARVSIPYQQDFIREKSHFSYLYYGASISAISDLAKKKGYSLVAGNTNGNNLFFVKDDLIGDLKVCEPKDIYVESSFRESRDEKKELSFLNFKERLDLISDLLVYDFDSGEVKKIKQVIN